jgi:transcriptional regulator with XRE-family HTH domain
MTSSLTKQENLAPKAKIVELLILLKSSEGFTNREMAAQLGVNENYLSRVTNGRAAGSEQLLAGLRLLLELENLKKEVVELRAGQAALRKFMGQSEIGGGANRLNEAGINSTAPERTVPATDRPPVAYVKRRNRKKLPPESTPPATT